MVIKMHAFACKKHLRYIMLILRRLMFLLEVRSSRPEFGAVNIVTATEGR